MISFAAANARVSRSGAYTSWANFLSGVDSCNENEKSESESAAVRTLGGDAKNWAWRGTKEGKMQLADEQCA